MDSVGLAASSLAMSAVTETYEEFRGSTVSAYSAGASQVDDGLLEIVRVEGPILEEALYQRYVKRGGRCSRCRRRSSCFARRADATDQSRGNRSRRW